MNRFLLLLASLIASFIINAQVKTPHPSPKSSLTQMVGLTEVSVDYSRPSVKGRVIYGNLVPFGKLWRTGANENTTVSFSEDVMISGTPLKKGKYALFTKPKADMWEIYFYSDTDNWGIPEKWNDSKVAAKVNAKPVTLANPVETLTISINNLTNDNATLDIAWEKTLVSLKIDVPTNKMAMANIEKGLAGPTANDYYFSAQYFYQANGDMNKALEYINKAISMSKPDADMQFVYTRLKSLIQAKLGDKKGATETAKVSLAGAEKAKNEEYIKMNNESIKEWSKK